MPYQENVAYKGLQNVSPVNYANNLFMLPPGFKVIVEAGIADTIYENQYPSLAYVDPEEVDAIIAEGRIDLKEVYESFVTAGEPAEPEETTPNPPAPASSAVAEVSSPGTDAPAEEAPTPTAPKFHLQWKAPAPQESIAEVTESPATLTDEASTSSASSPEPTTPDPVEEKKAEEVKPDLPKRPKLNRDK